MALRGLFIGIDRFADPAIRELTGCRRDALALWSLFSDTIPQLNGTILLDRDATVAVIRNSLREILSNACVDDVVIVSISSHGTHDHRLVAHDTDVTALSNSTLDMQEIADAFKATKARAVLCILDCCFSGGAPARVLEYSPITRAVATPLEAIAGNGRILIAASGVNEPALEHARHGLLTFALLEALQSAADTVSLPVAMDMISHRVRAEAERQGHVQSPVVLGHVEGGLVLPSLRRGKRFFENFPEAKGLRVTGDIAELAGFGLPTDLLAAWSGLFPNGLNELQLKAVNDHRILDGQSVFVIAPTGSGKTFIGELAAAKAISERRKAVFLFPYRALTNEKYDYFTQLYGETIGMRVIRCTGDYLDQTSDFIRGRYDLAVMTYEMYLSLSVSKPFTLDSLGLLVVDEVQFIIGSRGIVVELLLTNVLTAKERGVTTQIVALSAVVGSENGFDEWINASKLITTARPVPLIEGVVDRSGCFQFVDGSGNPGTEQLLPRHTVVQRRDKPSSQDVIVPLVKKLLSENASEHIIVFRNARGPAEGCAGYLASDLGLPSASHIIDSLPITDLSTTSQTLRKCLQGGTAFHNANLSREERVAVERAYRQNDGRLRVLTATTTIAAGINTPASTVILAEQEFIGEENQPFTIAEYKNMAGRAGRVGYQETGRAIILADTPTERDNLFRRYVLGKPEPLDSSFRTSELETWVLRLLSQVGKIRRDAVTKLLASTYGGYLAGKADPSWHVQTVQRLESLLIQMLHLGLVEEEAEFIHLTLLGRACGNSSLTFQSAMRLIEAIKSMSVAGTSLTVEQLIVVVQALPELDNIYTPLMKRGQAENRWPREVHQAYGDGLARHLQKHAADNWMYYGRCKRVVVLRHWIAGMPVESIEREATVNPYQGKIGFGDILRFADATRFYLRSAADLAAVMLIANGPDEKQVDSLLRRLEIGLPLEGVALLELPITLRRGEYLELLSAGIFSKAHVDGLSPESLAAYIGKTQAERLVNLRK